MTIRNKIGTGLILLSTGLASLTSNVEASKPFVKNHIPFINAVKTQIMNYDNLVKGDKDGNIYVPFSPISSKDLIELIEGPQNYGLTSSENLEKEPAYETLSDFLRNEMDGDYALVIDTRLNKVLGCITPDGENILEGKLGPVLPEFPEDGIVSDQYLEDYLGFYTLEMEDGTAYPRLRCLCTQIYRTEKEALELKNFSEEKNKYNLRVRKIDEEYLEDRFGDK